MKLQAVHDGRVYATEARRLLVDDGDWSFAERGRLPSPRDGWSDVGGRLKTGRYLKPLVEVVTGAFPTVNVWPAGGTRLVGTTDRWILASGNGGVEWTVTGRLPASSGPMGVLPSAFCRTDGTLYIGEYPLGDAVPRLLRSVDGGRSWTVATSLAAVRHVHAVQVDPYTGTVWLTTGDVDEECRIGRLVDGTFEPVGGGDQRWRAVELAFTPDAILWGMDSVYEPVNPIFRLRRADLGRADPPLEVLYELGSSVYYSAAMTVDGERWIVFSTTGEAGPDSTAPAGTRRTCSAGAAVVAASAASDFTTWHRLASYEKRRVPADLADGLLPSANAYVFLAASDARGLVVNPYNTATGDGTLRSFPPAYFADLA